MFNSFSLFLNSLFIISYILLFVKYFFKFFKTIFYLTENLFWRFSFSNFCIISYRLTFVKNFFNFFLKFYFLKLFGSDRQQLLYLITDLSACQELFKFFWKTFWTSFFRSSVLFLLATFTSYHRWSCLSRTFLFFLKTFLSFCRLRQRQVI